MRFLIFNFSIFTCSLLFIISCSKPTDDTSIPEPQVLYNKWQCEIDGKSYNGVIDSSFFQMIFGAGTADSIIVATGTSDDKKAHIHFKFSLDRTKSPVTGINHNYHTYLVFDTAANNLFTGNIPFTASPEFKYKLDTMKDSILIVSFNGTLTDQKRTTHPINGRFVCKLFSGNKDPNKFYCRLNAETKQGYFTSTMLNANTLIMTGVDYFDYPLTTFRITLRTGGTIKAGTYSSADGDVSFSAVAKSVITGPFYIDDSIGNLKIIIKSVKDNIVEGSFSGFNKGLEPVSDGKFICSVSNYIPQAESENRWSFGAWIEYGFGLYNCYAGNITSAVKSKADGRNYLNITGESDNGASIFRLVISNYGEITKGRYQIYSDNRPRIDSVYFKSGIATWDGIIPYLHAELPVSPMEGVGTYCDIEEIDGDHVAGIFYGEIISNLDDFAHTGSGGPRKITKGSFVAKF